MNREEWRSTYRSLRMSMAAVSAARIIHGGTYWTVRYIRERGRPNELVALPSIIRDRSPSHRIAHELEWAAIFRRRAIEVGKHAYYEGARRNHLIGAAMCLADARSVRLNASTFHRVSA